MKAREKSINWTNSIGEKLVIDEYQRGDTRVVSKFFLFPTRLKGVWRWGIASVIQEFMVWHDYDGDWWAWIDLEFVSTNSE